MKGTESQQNQVLRQQEAEQPLQAFGSPHTLTLLEGFQSDVLRRDAGFLYGLHEVVAADGGM